jgi:agarase
VRWCRSFVVFGLVLAVVAPAASAQAVSRRPDRSVAAPGRKQPKVHSTPFKATGYFTIGHEDGRSFFVTPTGAPFFSTGVDHVASDPDTDQNTDQCPYCETIQSEYPSTSAWETATVTQLRSWGFNSLGPFSDDSEFAAQMPYTVQLSMASGDDWFAPSFVTNADAEAAAQVAPRATDPDLIGWYTDSELTWGPDISNANTELQDYLALPAGSPGLAVARQYAGKPDKFLYALATRYFQVTTAAIRAYDPHHLILGVKAEGQYIQPQLLKAAGHYVNVFSVDDYALEPGAARVIDELWPQYLPVTANFANFERYAKIPIMVAEYSFIGETSETPDTVPGVYAVYPTQAARALAYTDYIAPLYEDAPWVVGDEWFEYVDEPQGGRVPDGENNNFGLVNVENQPYDDLVTQMEIMHSIAPDRLVQSGPTCDAWADGANGVVCTATMPQASYPPEIFGTALGNGVRGKSYSDAVVAGGGRPGYTFTIRQGSLPPGLVLHATSGDVTGKPKASGTFSVTVEVTDSSAPTPQSASQVLTVRIAPLAR